jgi:uncharacterized SAM-binding protein YcdF (DUF218 family)
MFFILSKILYFIVLPLCWITVFFIVSFFSKSHKRKKIFFGIALTSLLFFSNRFICDCFLKLWETPYVKEESLQEKYDYCIVLGGMATYLIDNHRMLFSASSDRILQALELYKKGRVKKIVLPGGSGDLFWTQIKESATLKDYLVTIGFPAEDIIVDNDSRNTYENARNVASLLKSEKNAKLLLVTSAFHMPRSIGCFKKQGLKFDIYPTDLQFNPHRSPSDFYLPSSEALDKWNLLIKEWMGYCAYKVKGYI